MMLFDNIYHSIVCFKIGINSLKSHFSFINYFCVIFEILCCHFNSLLSIFTRSRLPLKKPWYLLIHKKQLFIHLTFSWDCNHSITLGGSMCNSSSLAINTTPEVTSSIEVLSPSKSSVRVGINFFQASVNTDIFTSSNVLNGTNVLNGIYKCEFFTGGFLFFSFFFFFLSRRFSINFAQIHQRNNSLWQLYPYKMCFLKIKLESWNYSLIYGLQLRYWISRSEHNIKLLYVPIRALGWPGVLSMSSSILKGIAFSEQWVIKYSVNHIINRRSVIQTLLFHLRSTSRLYLAWFLKVLGFFKMAHKHWL